jgi:hypothetical protein
LPVQHTAALLLLKNSLFNIYHYNALPRLNMGIFDFFKKKKTTPETEVPTFRDDTKTETKALTDTVPTKTINDVYSEKQSTSDDKAPDPHQVYGLIYQYREYVIYFLELMSSENYSPFAAYESTNGDIIGFLFVGSDMSYTFTAQEAVERMGTELSNRLQERKINSYAIFFHSGNNNLRVADHPSQFKAVTVQYSSSTAGQGHISMPYMFKNDRLELGGFEGFSAEQNNAILETRLINEKDYFQERVEIKPELTENPIGIRIKKVNNGSIGNMWRGIFGYDRLAQQGEKVLMEYAALVLSRKPLAEIDGIQLTELQYGEVTFNAIRRDDQSVITVYPAVKAGQSIPVENKQINEWVNAEGYEAVIYGNGYGMYGLSYFATDYALQKAVYNSNTNLNISLSGILFVLDKADSNNIDTNTPLADDFAGYFPHQELGDVGCYHFVGIIKDFSPITLLEDGSINGYLLSVQLTNNPDNASNLLVRMFVNRENMRIANIEAGMSISGVFQLQGEIAGK